MTCEQTLDGVPCQETKPGHRTHHVEMDPRRQSPWFRGIKVFWIHPLKERDDAEFFLGSECPHHDQRFDTAWLRCEKCR